MNTGLIINLESVIAELRDEIKRLKQTKRTVFPSYTETERDALNNVKEGTVIYNTTDSKAQIYSSAVWIDLH